MKEILFERLLLGEPWPEDPSNKILRELAKEYHERTEAYDRTVCTGPVVRGSIMPATGEQMSLINQNARAIRKELEARLPMDRKPSDLQQEIIQFRKTR